MSICGIHAIYSDASKPKLYFWTPPFLVLSIWGQSSRVSVGQSELQWPERVQSHCQSPPSLRTGVTEWCGGVGFGILISVQQNLRSLHICLGNLGIWLNISLTFACFFKGGFSARFASLFSKSFITVTNLGTIMQCLHFLFLIIGTALIKAQLTFVLLFNVFLLYWCPIRLLKLDLFPWFQPSFDYDDSWILVPNFKAFLGPSKSSMWNQLQLLRSILPLSLLLQ